MAKRPPTWTPIFASAKADAQPKASSEATYGLLEFNPVIMFRLGWLLLAGFGTVTELIS